jgi:putative acetyltransferase
MQANATTALTSTALPQTLSLRDGRMVRLRAIRKEDDPAVANIIRTVMPEFGAVGSGFAIEDAEVDAMFDAYQGVQSRFIVIEHEGRLLGGGGLAPLEGGDPSQCEIKKMYYLRDVRGQGVGRHMFSLLLDIAKEKGFTHAYVETLKHMHAANTLYQDFGMTHLKAPLGRTGHCGCDTWYVKKL